MKKILQSIFLLFLYSCILPACDNDPLEEEGGNTPRTTVQFQTPSRDIAENAPEQTVLIAFDKPPVEDAILTLKASNQFGDAFTTTPAPQNGLIRIQVLKGDASAPIKIKPIDNSEQDGQRVVSLTFENTGKHFISGTNHTLTITVRDDETTNPNLESFANFIAQDVTLEETNTTGIEYQVHFSEAVAVDSEIKISLASAKGAYGTHYATEPAAENNIVTIAVAAGLRVVAFRIRPVANDEITGTLNVTMTISETSGSIRKGHNLEETLLVKDDELTQKPRGYEVTAGNAISKKFYEYDAQGRISRVEWENYAAHHYTHGFETYYYDGSGRLEKINKSPGRDIVYEWIGDRIVKSNDMRDGILHSYIDYGYDEAGNIGAVASYYRQQDGTFAKGFFTLYFYFLDGNLFKSLTYQETADPEEPFLLSTRTYDQYIDVHNPFPMSEVLPTKAMQSKLATTYRVEENGLDQTYHMTYEYRPDGLPEKRIATSSGDTQTAVYHYY